MPEIVTINTPFENTSQKKFHPIRWYKEQGLYVKLTILTSIALVLTLPPIFSEQNHSNVFIHAATISSSPTPLPTSTPKSAPSPKPTLEKVPLVQ